MTRSEFQELFLDELTGLLLRSFSVAEVTETLSEVQRDGKRGREMLDQQRRVKHLLGRMYDQITQATPTNGRQKVS